MDFSTYASLMATTALLAPLLEETVFRGFLLTRWGWVGRAAGGGGASVPQLPAHQVGLGQCR